MSSEWERAGRVNAPVLVGVMDDFTGAFTRPAPLSARDWGEECQVVAVGQRPTSVVFHFPIHHDQMNPPGGELQLFQHGIHRGPGFQVDLNRSLSVGQLVTQSTH